MRVLVEDRALHFLPDDVAPVVAQMRSDQIFRFALLCIQSYSTFHLTGNPAVDERVIAGWTWGNYIVNVAMKQLRSGTQSPGVITITDVIRGCQTIEDDIREGDEYWRQVLYDDGRVMFDDSVHLT